MTIQTIVPPRRASQTLIAPPRACLDAGEVAIFRRCRTLLLALTLAALTAPLATAQLTTVDLSASPASAQAYPGDPALFHVELRNDGLFARDIKLVAASETPLPAGWTYQFANDTFSLPAGGRANTTLVVHVPASAVVNSTVSFTFKGQDGPTDATRAQTVNVTVVARPASTQTQPTVTNAHTRPALAIATTTGDRGESGSVVTGVLTVYNNDPTRPSVRVNIEISGVASWKPTLADEHRFRNLPAGAIEQIPLRVTIPTLTEDASQTFTVLVTPEGFPAYEVQWTVRGLAPQPSPADEPAATSASTGSAPGPAPTPSPAPSPGMSISLAADVIDIAPGESASGKLHVVNTGTTTLRVSVSGSAPAEWAAPAFDATTFDLAPGAARDVAFTLAAPTGIPVPLGGTASGAGTLSAQTDSGLYRSVPYKVNIVPPTTPRQETSSAVVETPPTDASLPQTDTLVLGIAVGLGTVGAGAALLARRPLREKLLWGAIGLYTRIARPDVLGHEDRERLYRLVETTPGIHFHALQRDLAWNTGTLTYHLRVLERHGFMVSRRDGLYRRFYLQGAAPRKEVFENQGPTGLRADVLEAVRNQHGISQSDLALALSANKQTVNYHVKALERQGLIRVEKRGRDTYLYPLDASAPGVAQA